SVRHGYSIGSHLSNKTGVAPFLFHSRKKNRGEEAISQISATRMMPHITLREYKSAKLVEYVKNNLPLTKHAYDSNDRYYSEFDGAGHDGNPPHRLAPVWSEEAARTRPRH